MILLNNHEIELKRFPDNTLDLKDLIYKYCNYRSRETIIEWRYEDDRELLAVIVIKKHLCDNKLYNITLYLPYLPNARQDRTESPDEVFTLKYFANIINDLNFYKVVIFDIHSYVGKFAINNIILKSPRRIINEYVLPKIKKQTDTEIIIFYPDEGAMKRYVYMFDSRYVFGIKQRNWETRDIERLEISGLELDSIKSKTILIIDDICSTGGTVYQSAVKLKELGVGDIYLYISHCENTILKGSLLDSGLIKRIYTTNSIFTKEHEKIEVIPWDFSTS